MCSVIRRGKTCSWKIIYAAMLDFQFWRWVLLIWWCSGCHTSSCNEFVLIFGRNFGANSHYTVWNREGHFLNHIDRNVGLHWDKHRLVLWEVWHSNVCTNVIFLLHTKIAQILNLCSICAVLIPTHRKRHVCTSRFFMCCLLSLDKFQITFHSYIHTHTHTHTLTRTRTHGMRKHSQTAVCFMKLTIFTWRTLLEAKWGYQNVEPASDVRSVNFRRDRDL